MKNSTPWWLLLLFIVVVGIIELFVITRMITGAFDPRCLLPKGYIVAHTYTKGQETSRCVPDTP